MFRETQPGQVTALAIRALAIRALGAFCLVALALLASPGCSMIADTSDIDRACEKDFKYCRDIEACVSLDDPGFGCGRTSCEPCPAGPRQVMGCDNAKCVVFACTTQDDCEQPRP